MRYIVWSRTALLQSLMPGCTAGGAPLRLQMGVNTFPSQGERSNGRQHWTPGSSDSGVGTCVPLQPASCTNLKGPLTPASVSSPSHKRLGLDHLADILSAERSRDRFPGAGGIRQNLPWSASQPSKVALTGRIPGLSVQTQTQAC